MNSQIFFGNKTYAVAILITIYGIVFRGFGANDWNTAIIMISIALIGICLRFDMYTLSHKKSDLIL